jgi:hypothetical protein
MAHPLLRGGGLLIQQCFARHQKPRRADTALERGVFQELLLQRVESLRGCHPLYRQDASSLTLHGKHQARIHEDAIE